MKHSRRFLSLILYLFNIPGKRGLSLSKAVGFDIPPSGHQPTSPHFLRRSLIFISIWRTDNHAHSIVQKHTDINFPIQILRILDHHGYSLTRNKPDPAIHEEQNPP